MTATRTERDNTIHKISLSVLEIQDVQDVLIARVREPQWDKAHKQNCVTARDWLQTLIEGKPLISEIEVSERHWVLHGIGKACIADGLGGIGADILNQIGAQ